ncbi:MULTISPECIES: ECs_2282 family putative zinc-binding protein [Aeromonas]|uniref:ECs_2282 family putative zinc-binding protein n=1 Tax=Aeromonas TaxID=642 RepID=UPI0005CE5D6F|nr:MULTISPECIES: hypothetical protein [Aeromonas]WKS83268.1 transposase [Aeromonas caviae]AJQ54459.1 hypothetical protein RY45_10355 [Aeromonas hydrophila]MBL0601161.1 hypothetical protein [Aeromonas dhakensis]MBL0617437.1 hypothetical protein [Aeromonas dhakensis]MBL0657711.1 hypothetical protein [Aeromonas dhakensis]
MKKDYSIEVVILCPVCGNTQFETVSDLFFVCSDCKSEFDKDSLIEQNTISTETAIEELQQEFLADLKKDFKKLFKGTK